jgi:hypothetical protein
MLDVSARPVSSHLHPTANKLEAVFRESFSPCAEHFAAAVNPLSNVAGNKEF